MNCTFMETKSKKYRYRYSVSACTQIKILVLVSVCKKVVSCIPIINTSAWQKQTNKQTNNPRGNTHFWTDEQTRFMLNQLLLLLVVVKRSSGKCCITTSCNKNSATYRIGYDMLSANDSIYSLPYILG